MLCGQHVLSGYVPGLLIPVLQPPGWLVRAQSRRALIKSSQQYAVMALFDASNLIGSEASGSLVVLAFKPLSR